MKFEVLLVGVGVFVFKDCDIDCRELGCISVCLGCFDIGVVVSVLLIKILCCLMIVVMVKGGV